MKALIRFTIIILSTQVNAQSWQWANHIGSSYQFYGERGYVITDGTDLYLIGSFGGHLWLPDDTLYSNGNNDIFIAKFDASGTNLWSKQLGGNYAQLDNHEDAKGVYDPNCNCIYIAGKFKNTIIFGQGIGLVSSGAASDNFLARMDLDGNFIWARKLGGPGIENSPVVNVSPSGKVYILTQMEDSAYFGSFHVPPGGTIAQYDSLGNCLWAEHKFTAPVIVNTNGVFLDFIGSDLLIYGNFRSVPFQLDTSALFTNGNYDAFLARTDSLGGLKWVKKFGYSGSDYIGGLSVDNAGLIYFIGTFSDSINFGLNSMYSSSTDISLTKFDQNGNVIWAKQLFANGNLQAGNTILSDGDGNFYISGLFSGSASFGTFNVSTTNTYDMFVARYNPNGDCLGVRHFGRASNQALCVDNTNSVYISGAFYNTISIGSTNLTSYLGQDIYLAKLDEIVGLEEGIGRVSSNQLLIYSNPNSGNCTVTIPDEFIYENHLILQVIDQAGRLIRNRKIESSNDKVKLNLESLSKGTYIVTLSNGKKAYNGRMLVE